MFLEHGMKVVKTVLEWQLCIIVTVSKLKFGFMHEKGTIYAVFILRKLQDVYRAKGRKLYLCFVFLEKAFDGVLRKVL